MIAAFTLNDVVFVLPYVGRGVMFKLQSKNILETLFPVGSWMILGSFLVRESFTEESFQSIDFLFVVGPCQFQRLYRTH